MASRIPTTIDPMEVLEKNYRLQVDLDAANKKIQEEVAKNEGFLQEIARLGDTPENKRVAEACEREIRNLGETFERNNQHIQALQKVAVDLENHAKELEEKIKTLKRVIFVGGAVALGVGVVGGAWIVKKRFENKKV